MDNANPQRMLPGKNRNPQRETENSKSMQLSLTAPLPAECLAQSGLSGTLRFGVFCILAKIYRCLTLCVWISVLQRPGRSLRLCRNIQCRHPYVPTILRVFMIFGHDACLVTLMLLLRDALLSQFKNENIYAITSTRIMNLPLSNCLADVILTTFKLLFKCQEDRKLPSVWFVKCNARGFCLLVGSFKICVIFCRYTYDLFSLKNIVLSAVVSKFEDRYF